MARVKEGRKDTTNKMLDMKISAGKGQKEAQREMAGQHQRWHERIQDDEMHGAKSKSVAREALTTWRRHIL